MQQPRINNNKTNLIQPTNAFKARPDQGYPGGSAADIQYFESTHDKSRWVGKCSQFAMTGQSHHEEKQRYHEEWREYMGMDFYRYFGVPVPDTGLSLQPVNPLTAPLFNASPKTVCLHIMSKWVDDYTLLGDTFLSTYTQQSSTQKTYHVNTKDNQKIPLRGLGATLAVAAFIYDLDVIGNSGKNLGYVIRSDNQGPYAQIIKIDPGCAFSFIEDKFHQGKENDPRTRQIRLNPLKNTLAFKQLTPLHQREFLDTAKRILRTPRSALEKRFFPSLNNNFPGFTKQQIRFLMNRLLERKAQFMSAFSLEISNELREEITQVQSKQFTQYFKSSAPLKLSEDEKKDWLELQKANLELAKSRFQFNPDLNRTNPVKSFQLPRLAKDFVGRKNELLTIKRHFQGKKGIVYQGIQGLGGLGKTTLARRYAEFARTQNDFLKDLNYQAVIWLHVEQGLSDQFRTLAEVYKIRATKLNEMVTGVYRVLAQKRVLVVFDNVNTEADLKNFLPPKGNYTGLHILITTRNTGLSLNLREEPSSYWIAFKNLFTKASPNAFIQEPVTLMRFTPEDGRDYLKKQLEKPDNEEKTDPIDPKLYDAVVEAVYGIPLALTQASAYIQQGHCRLEDYPRRFAQSRLQQGVHDHQSPVLMTFLMAWFELRSTHPLAEPLLVACSYTAPDDIPLTYLRQLPHLKNASDNDLLATLIPLYQHRLGGLNMVLSEVLGLNAKRLFIEFFGLLEIAELPIHVP